MPTPRQLGPSERAAEAMWMTFAADSPLRCATREVHVTRRTRWSLDAGLPCTRTRALTAVSPADGANVSTGLLFQPAGAAALGPCGCADAGEVVCDPDYCLTIVSLCYVCS